MHTIEQRNKKCVFHSIDLQANEDRKCQELFTHFVQHKNWHERKIEQKRKKEGKKEKASTVTMYTPFLDLQQCFLSQITEFGVQTKKPSSNCNIFSTKYDAMRYYIQSKGLFL